MFGSQFAPVDRLALGVCTLILAILLASCGPGRPAANPGTPEWTIQLASIAAKKGDFASYVRHFTQEYQREELQMTVLLLTIHVRNREWAKSEGERSLRQVDAVLARENAMLKLLGTDWEWLSEVNSLGDEEELKAIAEFVGRIENPEEVWRQILANKPDPPTWWGRTDSVSIDGDLAKVVTYVEDRDTFDVELSLRRIQDEWKIEPVTEK